MSEQARYQRVIPYIAYADANAALEFLSKAFGFEVTMRMRMDDGRIGHAELVLDGEVVLMVASTYPEMGLLTPRELEGVHAQIKCLVDDLDAHYERAREAGATIASEPKESYGERAYRAVDLEGHRWIFGTFMEGLEGLEGNGDAP